MIAKSSDHTLEIEAHAEASTGTGAKATNQRHLPLLEVWIKDLASGAFFHSHLVRAIFALESRDDPNPSGSPSQPLLMSNGSSKPPAPDIL